MLPLQYQTIRRKITQWLPSRVIRFLALLFALIVTISPVWLMREAGGNDLVVRYTDNLGPLTIKPSGFDKAPKRNQKHVTGDDMYEVRRKFTLAQCAKLPRKNTSSLWYSMDETHNAIFCPIPKVASSFFRLLLGITGNKKYPNKRFTNDFFYTSLNTEFINDKTNNLKSMYPDHKRAMFVRDPWWRIYSAYVNKIYMPQVQYWQVFGKQAVRVGRKNASTKALKCGDDATFPEFVKLAIQLHGLVRPVDLHLVTYEERCDPCGMNYGMIGKLETFLADVKQLAKFFNISHYFDADYSTAYRDYEVYSTTRDVAERFYDDIRKCITIDDALFRLWTYLKLRGRIDPDRPVPQIDAVAYKGKFIEKKLIRTIMAAYKKSTSKQRNVYKTQAFKMAYQMIPLEDKLKLRDLYWRDFVLFGYNPMPYDVFNSTEKNKDIKLFLQ